jgi:hypothetical protein
VGTCDSSRKSRAGKHQGYGCSLEQSSEGGAPGNPFRNKFPCQRNIGNLSCILA